MNQPDGVSVPGRDPRTRPAKGDRLRNPIILTEIEVTEVRENGVWCADARIGGEFFITAAEWPKTWGRKIIEVVG